MRQFTEFITGLPGFHSLCILDCGYNRGVRREFILSPLEVFSWINFWFSNLFIKLCTNPLFVAVGCFCKCLKWVMLFSRLSTSFA